MIAGSTPNTKNTTKTSGQIYNHFNQAKSVIHGIEAIDYFFAKEMVSALLNKRAHDITAVPFDPIANLTHLFLALSASLRAGHSCLPLTEVADQHWGKAYSRQAAQNTVAEVAGGEENADGVVNSQEHTIQLSHIGFVFAPLTQLQTLLTELYISAIDNQLLVFNDNKLYLRRYFQFENDLGDAINARLVQPCQFENEAVAQCISALFPENTDDQANDGSPELDWQKIAVANAINKNFSVIAGGPGTGKTYTVTKLLAALVMLNKSGQQKRGLNIALVAPTGKAAQRLSESIVDAVAGFKSFIDANVLAEIPTQAQTIHRLLGVLPNSPNFKHQEDNLLSYDIVLIDEVSMVDLPLMTRIFRALKPQAKVILLGDADQLPSVAAGSVLADIAPRPHGGYSAENNAYLAEVCQLNNTQLTDFFTGSQCHENAYCDYLTFLVKSRRFDGQGGIGLLAASVIKGDTKTSWGLLTSSVTDNNLADTSQLKSEPLVPAQLSLAQGELSQWLAPLVKQYYQPIASCKDVKGAFALLSQFRVLCATRQGDYGVEHLNDLIKSYLGKNNSPYQQSQQVLYHGQPIMINENDYRLGLYNGDIGIIWQVIDQAGNTHLMACFEDNTAIPLNSEGDANNALVDDAFHGIRQILPSRLPKFESVYAMTIHKTQGSEFAHVAMVISATQGTQEGSKQARGSKLLSRELLYTGITRAKKQLTIAANQSVWQQGVKAKVQRHSGLRLYPLPEG
jgi:exodeoxyribonuclease V alpha subunit